VQQAVQQISLTETGPHGASKKTCATLRENAIEGSSPNEIHPSNYTNQILNTRQTYSRLALDVEETRLAFLRINMGPVVAIVDLLTTESCDFVCCFRASD
jgi:hypothetical protein